MMPRIHPAYIRRVLLLWTLLIALIFPMTAHPWCWIRDTGTTSTGCIHANQYRQNCCTGNLRLWPNGNMDYHIMATTPDQLHSKIRQGVSTWNDVAMSTFTFTDKGTSSLTSAQYDGTNLIGIDPNFATNNNLVGQGILAISSTWSQFYGSSNYRAVDSDIIFNGEEYTWGDGTGNTRDTIGVTAHEAGHSAGLSHAGAGCQNAGSEGCGVNFGAATMYWNYNGGQPTTKASLELDDVAALIHGYPKATFRVRVLDSDGNPLSGVSVKLLDAAAPVNGTSITQGGKVMGDVTNPDVLMGDKAFSSSYINQTPFSDTDDSGCTNTISPTHRTIRIEASKNGVTRTLSHILYDGTSKMDLVLANGLGDMSPPTLSVTSHMDGAYIAESSITLSGTASDSGRGDSGIQSVTIDGTAASNGTASGGQTASWSLLITLSEGDNMVVVSAQDGSAAQNMTSQLLTFIHDTTAPSLVTTTPSSGQSNVSADTTLNALFTEEVKPATVTTASFTLATNSGDLISGQVAYNEETRTASFTPNAALSAGTTYTATLTTAIQDKAGNALSQNHSWSFTTTPPPDSGDSGSGGCFINSCTGAVTLP
ncbi:MAG: Ig-like domain-containing protein [Desulfobacterales bacterium]|nr:Ig-like domain-containing protein [Desulfobacterales bacterium]